MAVYTKINKKDIDSINNQFEMEKIIHFKGIKKGIENTNYLLKTKKNKFILTIFEKRVSNIEIPFFMKLMEILNNSNISCPKPLKSKKGSHLINLKNKKKIGITKKNSMSIKELGPLLKSIKFKSKKFNNLQNFLANNLKDIKKNWPSKLPQGVIHGDLFIDNIFFNKNKLSGVIDFYFAANDIFMYEIAICINALCFDYKNQKFVMNKQKIKELIKGYESVKEISLKEKKSLNILCRGAAMRYLLTRLYDYSNTPKTALIKIKDPNEYYQKLITHNNLKSYKDYLN